MPAPPVAPLAPPAPRVRGRLPSTAPKEEMVHRSVRMPSQLQHEVEVKAAMHGTSLNAVVVASLRAYVA